jgi:hypothetical protein
MGSSSKLSRRVAPKVMVNESNMAWYCRFVSVNGFSLGSGEGLLVVEVFFSEDRPLRLRLHENVLIRANNLVGESGAEVAVDVEGVGLEEEKTEAAAEDEDSEEGRGLPMARLNLSRIVMMGGGYLLVVIAG